MFLARLLIQREVLPGPFPRSKIIPKTGERKVLRR
jgi:hypothetical protein